MGDAMVGSGAQRGLEREGGGSSLRARDGAVQHCPGAAGAAATSADRLPQQSGGAACGASPSLHILDLAGLRSRFPIRAQNREQLGGEALGTLALEVIDAAHRQPPAWLMAI